MSVTSEGTGDKLVLPNTNGEILENQPNSAFSEAEIAVCLSCTPLEFAQLESIFRESEEDWGASLDGLTLP